MLVHSGERPFSCEICGQTFTTNGNMHRHKRTHGSRDSHESDVSSGGSSGTSSKRKKRKVSLEQQKFDGDMPGVKRSATQQEALFQLPGSQKCPLCSESFFSERSLETHIAAVHPGESIKCNECQHPFNDYNYLKLHKNMYHHKPETGSFHSNFPSLSALSSLTSIASIGAFKQAEEKQKLQQKKTHQDESVHISPVKTLPLGTPKMPVDTSFPNNSSGLASSTPKSMDQVSTTDSVEQHDENEGLLREMKLKGEFPCRLCPAVYPNLRALKGHNKEHWGKPPYTCNVAQCTYSSADKGTLARHMRAHTGEKPFECKECNFGFTTKANCERHVKNKHGKNSRTDIRDAIVIHDTDDLSKDQSDESINMSPVRGKKRDIVEQKPPKPSSLFAPYHATLFRSIAEENEDSKEEETPVDAPLDLSRPTPPSKTHHETDQKAKPELTPDAPATSELLKPFMPPVAAALNPLTGHPMPLPLIFQQLTAASSGGFDFAAYILAHQEMLRRQREAAQQSLPSPAKDPASFLLHLSNLQSNYSNAASLQQRLLPTSPTMASSPKTSQGLGNDMGAEKHHQEDADSESDYKMVIKNGVLMKKQKQRRYRTERPYGCDHCNARFTLRSNMERHVKQQHPEHYGKLKVIGEHAFAENGKERHGGEEDFMSNEEDELVEETNEIKDEEEEEPLVVDDVVETKKAEKAESVEENGIDLSQDSVETDGYMDNEDEIFSDEAGSNCSMEEGGRKMSAYSSAPNRIPCPYCNRKFPWTSSLNRHILTHTGDKPYKCAECPLWFTTKSNCDRHLVRKHGDNNNDKEMKNAPERPFKCSLCPSSTFSSEGKLRRHQHEKHPEREREEEKSTSDEQHDHNSSRESAISDFPFKCHLCDDGFAERTEAIDHLKNIHAPEYDALVAKGAFDAEIRTPPSVGAPATSSNGDDETYEQLRGRFPDYVNRKVICLFCMRKFWSAEDLRRHSRTHTGERPYSCDICRRKFTLKHSMLRHRKKHDSGVSSSSCGEEDEDGSSGEESLSAEGVTDESSSVAAHQARGHTTRSSSPEERSKKRANLMDKINRLTAEKATTNSSDPEIR